MLKVVEGFGGVRMGDKTLLAAILRCFRKESLQKCTHCFWNVLNSIFVRRVMLHLFGETCFNYTRRFVVNLTCGTVSWRLYCRAVENEHGGHNTAHQTHFYWPRGNIWILGSERITSEMFTLRVCASCHHICSGTGLIKRENYVCVCVCCGITVNQILK